MRQSTGNIFNSAGPTEMKLKKGHLWGYVLRVNVRLWNTLEVRISKNIPPGGQTLASGSPRSNLVTEETHQLTSGHLGDKEERKVISKETMRNYRGLESVKNQQLLEKM